MNNIYSWVNQLQPHHHVKLTKYHIFDKQLRMYDSYLIFNYLIKTTKNFTVLQNLISIGYNPLLHGCNFATQSNHFICKSPYFMFYVQTSYMQNRLFDWQTQLSISILLVDYKPPHMSMYSQIPILTNWNSSASINLYVKTVNVLTE